MYLFEHIDFMDLKQIFRLVLECHHLSKRSIAINYNNEECFLINKYYRHNRVRFSTIVLIVL